MKFHNCHHAKRRILCYTTIYLNTVLHILKLHIKVFHISKLNIIVLHISNLNITVPHISNLHIGVLHITDYLEGKFSCSIVDPVMLEIVNR